MRILCAYKCCICECLFHIKNIRTKDLCGEVKQKFIICMAIARNRQGKSLRLNFRTEAKIGNVSIKEQDLYIFK